MGRVRRPEYFPKRERAATCRGPRHRRRQDVGAGAEERAQRDQHQRAGPRRQMVPERNRRLEASPLIVSDGREQTGTCRQIIGRGRSGSDPIGRSPTRERGSRPVDRSSGWTRTVASVRRSEPTETLPVGSGRRGSCRSRGVHEERGVAGEARQVVECGTGRDRRDRAVRCSRQRVRGSTIAQTSRSSARSASDGWMAVGQAGGRP